jgi:hypothetical protein
MYPLSACTTDIEARNLRYVAAMGTVWRTVPRLTCPSCHNLPILVVRVRKPVSCRQKVALGPVFVSSKPDSGLRCRHPRTKEEQVTVIGYKWSLSYIQLCSQGRTWTKNVNNSASPSVTSDLRSDEQKERSTMSSGGRQLLYPPLNALAQHSSQSLDTFPHGIFRAVR